jgi:surface antigen
MLLVLHGGERRSGVLKMHLSGIHGRVCLLAVTLACVPLDAAAQSNLRFLRDTPISRFNDADMRLMFDAGRAALDSSEPGATREWRNEKTRHSGRITVQQQFVFESRDCRRLNVESRSRSMESQTVLSVCRVGGAWKIDTKALPAAR